MGRILNRKAEDLFKDLDGFVFTLCANKINYIALWCKGLTHPALTRGISVRL